MESVDFSKVKPRLDGHTDPSSCTIEFYEGKKRYLASVEVDDDYDRLWVEVDYPDAFIDDRTFIRLKEGGRTEDPEKPADQVWTIIDVFIENKVHAKEL